MTTTLDGPRNLPPGGARPDSLVVLLHGYGADGNDLIDLAQHWRPLLPRTAFVAPHAPERIPGMPYGFQWFSLAGYDPMQMRRDPARTAEVYRGMETGAMAAATLIDRFLDAELARHGVPAGRLALVGFSQGTMMSLHVGLRRPVAPAAIVGFSGALVGGDRLKDEITCRPPVLLIHGDADEMVPVTALFGAAEGLAAAGLTVRWHISKGLGHGIDPAGLEMAGHFLAQSFAQPLAKT
jgi:phospholipase/carboxylesterase